MNMYVAQEQRAIACIPVVVVVITQFNEMWSWGMLTSIGLLILLALPVFISYHVRIDMGLIHLEMRYFRWTVYRRIIQPEDIEQIRFNRYDWKKKGAVLRMKKGRKLRLVHFEPLGLMEKLESFADLYHVDYLKSKDYQLIERMEHAKKRPQY